MFVHTGQKTISSIRSKFNMSQTKFQKSISFLENNGFINNVNEVISLGESADFETLLRRPEAGQSAIKLLEEKFETSSLFYAVNNYESFAPSLAMPAKCREVSYMIFERLGWDTARPFDKITNTKEWMRDCRQLLALCSNDLRLVRDAIDLLKEKNYTVVSPRSLIKTVAMIKGGVDTTGWKSSKKSEDSMPEIF
jgi:hypothetical protein